MVECLTLILATSWYNMSRVRIASLPVVKSLITDVHYLCISAAYGKTCTVEGNLVKLLYYLWKVLFRNLLMSVYISLVSCKLLWWHSVITIKHVICRQTWIDDSNWTLYNVFISCFHLQILVRPTISFMYDTVLSKGQAARQKFCECTPLATADNGTITYYWNWFFCASGTLFDQSKLECVLEAGYICSKYLNRNCDKWHVYNLCLHCLCITEWHVYNLCLHCLCITERKVYNLCLHCLCITEWHVYNICLEYLCMTEWHVYNLYPVLSLLSPNLDTTYQ